MLEWPFFPSEGIGHGVFSSTITSFSLLRHHRIHPNLDQKAIIGQSLDLGRRVRSSNFSFPLSLLFHLIASESCDGALNSNKVEMKEAN
jgi:hypothetical protein